MCTPMLAAGIGMLGGVVQGIGAAQQRETNAQSYILNAQGLERDIETEKATSAYDIARTRETVAKTQGGARAGYAASGLALSGSAAEVLRETAIEGDLDVEAIRWSSSEKQKSLRYQAGTLRHNAGQERAAAPMAFISPVLSGVARFGGSFG